MNGISNHPRSAPRGTRRIIYHSDPSNATAHLPDPTTPENLRELLRLYVREAGIDTYVQEVFSSAMTHYWRTDTCDYDVRPNHQRFVPMMDDGVMPVEVLIDECGKQGIEFIAGWRMNDRHGHNPAFFKTLNEERPEWILDVAPSYDGAPDESRRFGCAVDYSCPEVRAWQLAIMTDMAQRFAVDGFELNFMRLPECFPPATAAECHPIMTEFIRDVRKLLDETGTGRRRRLGVRVPQQLATCFHFGYDVPGWIAEGLIDYVSPSDWQMTDFNERYEDFVCHARGTDCYVYPQLTTWIGFKADIYMNPARYRAAVTNFYGAGCDGFCPLQFDFHWKAAGSDPVISNYPPELCDLEDAPAYLRYIPPLRDPDGIAAGGDRHYVFLPLWREDIKTYHREEIVLSRSTPDCRGEFRCRICEIFPVAPSGQGGLTFLPVGMTDGDEIAVDINGKPIPSGQLQWDGTSACTIALSAPPFVYGDNVLGLTLTKAATAEGEITVERVECVVSAEPEGHPGEPHVNV